MADGNERNEAVICLELSMPHMEEEEAVAVKKTKSLRARFIYGFIFLSTNLLAWFVRDYGHKVLTRLQPTRECGVRGENFFHVGGVLRVSLGCSIFFLSMLSTTFRARKLNQARNTWHSGWWTLKFFLYLMSLLAAFTMPGHFIHIYGEVARVGAGIFLFFQLISLIQLVTWCNCQWMPDSEPIRSGFIGLFLSTLFYLASFGGLTLLYFIYVPDSTGILNIIFITWTAILVKIMMVISLHSKVNTGLLSSGIMGLYIVYLCWSAIQSEPFPSKRNFQNRKSESVDWITILSFLLAVCSIVISTFTMGTDSQSFQFRKDEAQAVDDIPYKYEVFHFIFSMGAMYFAMLFISWELDHPTTKWSIDVGWASTWVKIINELAAVILYLWKLIWPIVVRNRPSGQEVSA